MNSCGTGTCMGMTSCPVTINATAKRLDAATMPTDLTTVINAPLTLNDGSVTFGLLRSEADTLSDPPSKMLTSPATSVSWNSLPKPPLERGAGFFSFSATKTGANPYRYLGTVLVPPNPTPVLASNVTLTTGQSATFYAVYGNAGPWHQTMEGDVYAAESISTYIPTGATSRLYSRAPTGGMSGVISTNSLSIEPTPVWRVTGEDTLIPAINFYAVFSQKAKTTTRTALTATATTITAFPASGIYTWTDPTADKSHPLILNIPAGNTLPDDRSVVYLVDGNVTISSPIHLANHNRSFFAVIASGTISIANGIGGSEAAPGIEGVYLASTFQTLENLTAAPPHIQLVARGMVGAATVNLARDLGDAGNPTTPAELFMYDPALPFTMPEWMKDLHYEWREVAP